MYRLGELLRELRRTRGLSQERLAAQAQVTPRTLRYWETNQQQPREMELESVLNALSATASERAQVCGLLTAPRGVRLAQAEASRNPSATMLGPLPGVGDLLRAMRVRRQWTQERLADEMSVNRATVIRWEATRSLPSDDGMERLCSVLQALPEEQLALRNRYLNLSSWQAQLTLEECGEQYKMLLQMRAGTSAVYPLADLHLLALKQQLRFLLSKSPEALRLLANVEIHHGWWLYMQGRTVESCAVNWRALNLMRGNLVPEEFWARPLNILAGHAASSAQGPELGIKLLHPWLRLLPISLHSWLLCDMALYAGQAQRHDDATDLLKQALRALQCHGKDSGVELRHFHLTTARVLLSCGKATEALDWLPPLPPDGDGRIHELIVWAEVYAASGEKNAATRYANDAHGLLIKTPMPKRQAKLDRLSQQL